MSSIAPPAVTTDIPASADIIGVEVIYALPQHQERVALKLVPGSTLQQAIDQSGLAGMYPEVDFSKLKAGIYGKLSKADTVLRDRDRVELYRPLLADPKEVRKQRAAEGKVMKKGGGEE